MHITFINYGVFCVSSGVHMHFIANEFIRMGHACTIVVPEVRDSEYFGKHLYELVDYITFLKDAAAGKYPQDTVLHAWTPRENVRQVTQAAAGLLGVPYVVHLEDNERRLLESKFHKPFSELVQIYRKEPFPAEALSHPVLHQIFLAEAAGVSILMDTLGEFVPKDVPTQLIWPSCEEVFFQLPVRRSEELRRQFQIPEDVSVIVYPGNIHYANAGTIVSLYQALPLMEARGHKVLVLRCSGTDYVMFNGSINDIRDKYVRFFPESGPTQLPMFLRLADVLVQPGKPDDFDNYRFPSKLPLFLASGRPVVLAKANVGRFLTDGQNCLLLRSNTPEHIADRVVELLGNPELAGRIGQGGREFAREHFNWSATAQTLLIFYARILR